MKIRHFFRLFLLMFCISFGSAVFAQQPNFLERNISIAANNEGTDLFLNRLSKEVGCVFSYSPSTIAITKKVSGKFTNQSTREILETVFEGQVNYKQKGVYLILSPAPKSEKEITISGYVVDQQSGQRVKDATIYNPITLQSATSDEYGYFQFQIKNPAAENFQLIINKKEFSDTLLVEEKKSSFQKIFLKNGNPKVNLDAVTEPIQDFWLWTKKSVGFKNLENFQDTIYRQFQFSVIPFIGTNRKLSGSVTNAFSFNLLGGFSGGTEKLEVGGVFNFNRGDVSNVQLAGLINQTSGKVRGLQMAGLVNANLDSVNAAQFAGVVNFSTGNVNGVQAAGVLNLVTKNVNGTQLAGLANVAFKDVKGAQIGAVLNVARNVKGIQIGLLNYAHSIQGVQLGFLNFSRRGYHTIELSSDEILPINIALRSGTRPFYTMLLAGLRPEQTDSGAWAFGYGIGTSPRLGKKLFLNFELSSQQLIKGNIAALNLVTRAYLGLDFQVTKWLSFFAGPTLNLRVYDPSYLEHPTLFTFSGPNILSEKKYPRDNLASQSWWGFRGGVRFF